MIRKSIRKEPSLSNLIHDLDGIFSRYIRLRDTVNGHIRCYICGYTMSFFDAQVGHYIDRDQMPTRYDEMNCHSVCKECNCFDDNHKIRYYQALLLAYGQSEIDDLWIKSKGLQKFMRFEIEELIEHYRVKVSELKKKV